MKITPSKFSIGQVVTLDFSNKNYQIGLDRGEGVKSYRTLLLRWLLNRWQTNKASQLKSYLELGWKGLDYAKGYPDIMEWASGSRKVLGKIHDEKKQFTLSCMATFDTATKITVVGVELKHSMVADDLAFHENYSKGQEGWYKYKLAVRGENGCVVYIHDVLEDFLQQHES